MSSVAPSVGTSPSVPSIAETRKNERSYFDESKMAPPTIMYVCWIDVMGSESIMLRSLSIASNFLMKLHVAALRASQAFPVELYPIIDGVYACSDSQSTILRFVNRLTQDLQLRSYLKQTHSTGFRLEVD